MTGFGTATIEESNFKAVVEVKSLNSKFLDANLRLPRAFNDKELEVRNLLANTLERGKVSLSIEFAELSDSKPKVKINKAIVKAYFDELNETAAALGVTSEDTFRMAMQMPQATEPVLDSEDTDEIWSKVKQTIELALQNCNKFRDQEGKQLEEKISSYIHTIAEMLDKVNEKDPERVKNIKDRVKQRIKDLKEDDSFDENRFEQEMIYYIEKLDISEEKVRLKTHLDYFLKTMESKEANGKKLGFISQEIGREINTIGSKANDASIQQYVVKMKEELEKIKEQALNIL